MIERAPDGYGIGPSARTTLLVDSDTGIAGAERVSCRTQIVRLDEVQDLVAQRQRHANRNLTGRLGSTGPGPNTRRNPTKARSPTGSAAAPAAS